MNAFKKYLVDRLFGHDFFVSYARADASDYAQALVSKLKERAFAQFLDVESIRPGSNIEQVLQRALKRSSFFILLISKGALCSEWVPWELETYVKEKPNRAIPIELDNSLESKELNGTPFAYLQDRLIVREPRASDDPRGPSETVVEAVQTAILNWEKHRRQIKLFRLGFIYGFLLGVAVASICYWLLF